MTHEHEPDLDRDRPPRWGRRLFIAAVLLLALPVGGFFAWTASGRSNLGRQVAAYRAAGEPIEVEDFIVAGVPDEDNAALALLEAAASLDTKSDAWNAYEKRDPDYHLPLTDKEAAALRAVVAANAASVGKIDEAMTRKGVDWKIPFRSPAITTLLPHLNTQRQLARFVVARAKLNYQQGDHAEAVRDLRRCVFIGRTVGRGGSFLVTHLVHLGIVGHAVGALEEMQPGLKVGTGAGEVPPAEVAALIALLLDDKPQRASFRDGMLGERMTQLDTAQCLADGRLSLAQLTAVAGPGVGGRPGAGPNIVASAASFAAKPIALSDALLMIRHTTAVRQAHEKSPDWPTYEATVPPFPREVQNSMVRHIVARVLLPNMERAATNDFRQTAERRLTAAALAARWYAVDHGGKLPAKLEDLVPKYLPALPLDPFAAPPQPIRYVNDPEKPIVYSVGEDGRDGGGSELLAPPNTNPRQATRWQKLDAVVHLKPQPRDVPEEPEAADDAEPEIYPNEKEIREAAKAAKAATQPATEPAP